MLVEHYDILVFGGGYIGIEMAQAFRYLGSKVVVVESGKQLAAREDSGILTHPTLTEGLNMLFSKVGPPGNDVAAHRPAA